MTGNWPNDHHFDADDRLVIWLAAAIMALVAALAVFGWTDTDDVRTNEQPAHYHHPSEVTNP